MSTVLVGGPVATSLHPIVASARRRIEAHGIDYGYDSAPYSPQEDLPHNSQPDRLPIDEWKDRNKCNLFGADVLHDAGYPPPKIPRQYPEWLTGAGENVAIAEDWPKYAGEFDTVPSFAEASPGDVIIIDFSGTGASTAHVEILESVPVQSPDGGYDFVSAGAHEDGAYEKVQSTNALGGSTTILRPKRPDGGGAGG